MKHESKSVRSLVQLSQDSVLDLIRCFRHVLVEGEVVTDLKIHVELALQFLDGFRESCVDETSLLINRWRAACAWV